MLPYMIADAVSVFRGSLQNNHPQSDFLLNMLGTWEPNYIFSIWTADNIALQFKTIHPQWLILKASLLVYI